MNEPNTNKTNKAPELAGGGVLKHDVTLATTGKAGEYHTETEIKGTRGDILLALASTVSGVIRSLIEGGNNPLLAALIVTDAVKQGIESGMKQSMEKADE